MCERKVPIQDEIGKWKCKANVHDKNCQAHNESVYADQKCQTTKHYKIVDKNCQITNMQPVKLEMDMQPKEPAMQSSFKKNHILLCKDRNCQPTRCYRKESNEIPNVQMRTKKPISHMQSVTKTSVMWLSKPVMK